MNVAAIIVTRGDQEDGVEDQILPSLPVEWEKLVWDNGQKTLYRYPPPNRYWNVADLSVYGRYAAIEYTDAELIYVQDDDCVVGEPQSIVGAWYEAAEHPDNPNGDHVVVCNMPPEFRRHDFYEEHALVGFGACFHRDAPRRAFARYEHALGGGDVSVLAMDKAAREHFYRTCDIVFTALTPRVLVDVPVENMPWAYDADRMYRQPDHVAERKRMLDLVRNEKVS